MSSYAAAWKAWFPLIEGGAAPLTRRLIALAEIGPGQNVLDVGTGIGEPALTAARKIGAGGQVLAIDPDATMLAIAEERKASAGIGNVEFRCQSAEDLEAPEAAFDAAVARWSLMFVDDLAAVLARLRRALRPGGRFAGAVWGPPERVPGLALARRAIHRHLGIAPPPYGPKTAFALADTDALMGALAAAGFTDVVREWFVVNYEFPSAENYLRFRTDCTGSLFSGAGEISDAERKGAIAAVDLALEPFRLADGTVRFENWACCVAARVGGSSAPC